uniref:CYP74A7 n=1 Tax=Arundo donax TaxID=35708 RepID=A0A0A9G6P6_ARUDO
MNSRCSLPQLTSISPKFSRHQRSLGKISLILTKKRKICYTSIPVDHTVQH